MQVGGISEGWERRVRRSPEAADRMQVGGINMSDVPGDIDGGAAEERAARLAKVEELRARGVEPYPIGFDRTHSLAALRDGWNEKLAAGDSTDDEVRVAGRVMLVRHQGKLIFVTLRDGTGDGQLFVSQGDIGEGAFAQFRDDIDRGDWVGVTGTVMKSKRGELSVRVQQYNLLSKALRPLPEKWARAHRCRYPLPPALRRPHCQ